MHSGTHNHPLPLGQSRAAYVNMTETIHQFLDDEPFVMAALGWVGFWCANKNFFDLVKQSTSFKEKLMLNKDDLVRLLESAPSYHDKGRVKQVVTSYRADQKRCIFVL